MPVGVRGCFVFAARGVDAFGFALGAAGIVFFFFINSVSAAELTALFAWIAPSQKKCGCGRVILAR